LNHQWLVSLRRKYDIYSYNLVVPFGNCNNINVMVGIYLIVMYLAQGYWWWAVWPYCGEGFIHRKGCIGPYSAGSGSSRLHAWTRCCSQRS